MDTSAETIEGSWEEISRQADKLNGHRLRVTILPDVEQRPGVTKTSVLLDALDAEDDDATPEDIEQGKRDWEAFKTGINRNRAAASARLVYT